MMSAVTHGHAPDDADDSADDRLSELAHWWHSLRPGEPADVERIVAAELDAAREQALAAVEKGADLVLLTVPDAGAPGYVAVAALLDLDAAEVLGWPSATGMPDAEWLDLAVQVRDDLRRLRGPWTLDQRALSTRSPEDLLSALGEGPLAAGCAVLQVCADGGVPLLVEGASGAVSAVLVQRADPPASQWWRLADGPISASSLGSVPGARGGLHERTLSALGAEPLLRLGLHHPTGTAADLALHLLTTALTLHPAPAPAEPAPSAVTDDGDSEETS